MGTNPMISPHKRPLTGRRIVITRPREQSRELHDSLEALGAEVIAFPTMKIVPAPDLSPLRAALDRIDHYDWVLFTSRNAVDAVARELGHALPTALGEVRIAVVGQATRRRLQELGLQAHFVPSKFNLGTLCAELIQAEQVTAGRFLYPCGDLADPDGPRALRGAGAIVDMVVSYRTVPDEHSDAAGLQHRFANGEINAVVFASPSAVNGFFALIERKHIGGQVALVSIGPKTTKTLQGMTDCPVFEATKADTQGLVDTLVRNVSR